MCLAVPGKLVEIIKGDELGDTGKVSFGGALREVSLAYVPEAKVGDYLVVHVGFALSIVDEEEAHKIFADLEAIDEMHRQEDAEKASQ